MLIAAGFAVFTIVQAPASAFALLVGLLVIGTGYTSLQGGAR
jgi:hypothetical protein